ncbi:uncharacterized protein LOC121419886 isoform X1 [Lytechinus variegatus]|uniref:uncharacterized protein LOC121419886 isoform X1 n=1 Tax=Lytechinus variegatus TaxID=7654 RepID=UPI001BB1D9ED|nr:uncharacterized protein LOC121419886 isoform X1 [Lytechinus variegatus]
MKENNVLVEGFGGPGFYKNVKETIGSNHVANELHFQSNGTFSSSTDLTMRPIAIGPAAPTAFPIQQINTQVNSTTNGVYSEETNGVPLNTMKDETLGKGQSSVPTFSNGFISDVSNAWLHTLADLCDWKSKQDNPLPHATYGKSTLTPAVAQECEKSLSERGNALARKDNGGLSANSSMPRNDYMISTILAGSSGSGSNHDAMITHGVDISHSNRSTNVKSSEMNYAQNGISKTAFRSSPEVPSIEHLRVMGESPTTLEDNGEVANSQATDESISSIPMKNLPPRKRHKRSLVSPPTVEKSPSKSHDEHNSADPSSSTFQYKPDHYYSSALSEEPPKVESLQGTDSLSSFEVKKGHITADSVDACQVSKRLAVDRVLKCQRDSPSSLESNGSSSSDVSYRGSPMAIEGSDSGIYSGNSSRSGDTSPCQPNHHPSIVQQSGLQGLQQQLPLHSTMTMPAPNGQLQRPGDLQVQSEIFPTNRYNINQEMLPSYSSQIPQMAQMQQIPGVLSQDSLSHTQIRLPVGHNVLPAQLNTSNQGLSYSRTLDTNGPIVPTSQTPPIGGTTLRPIPLHYQNGYAHDQLSGRLEQNQPRIPLPRHHLQDMPRYRSGPLPPQTLAQNAFPQFTHSTASNMWVPPIPTTRHQGLLNGFTGASQNATFPHQQPPMTLATPVTSTTSQSPTTTVEYAPLKRAPGRSRLNNHVSSGLPMGDSTFLCEVCNKVFPLQRLLNRHMKCHSATKRYNCAFCGKGFNDTFDLKRHVRTHTGVRPYKCDKCGKAFTQRCSLESHLSKVHGEQHRYTYKQRRSKIFVCEECGITTETADCHYNHIKEKHPDSTELRKYQDKLQFQKLVMQQENAGASADGESDFMRSRPDLSPTSELMLYREHDEATLPLQNHAEQQRRMSEMRSPGDVSPVSSGSSGSGEDRMVFEYRNDIKTERAGEISPHGNHSTL